MNKVFYKSSTNMSEMQDCSVDLVVTSPPYYNIKDYSKGTEIDSNDAGSINDFEAYISQMLLTWKECERVLKPNGKICINVPLMPIEKKYINTHHTRHIYNLSAEIQQSILGKTNLYLMNQFIWSRTNGVKGLMFGSYPYPSNYYSQNTCEFIDVYVKGGKPVSRSKEIKERSKLSQKEWVEWTKHVWALPIPNKAQVGYADHEALMPVEIANRCIRLFSFADDVVLDPFTGSGTTLGAAINAGRRYVGYEIYKHYEAAIKENTEERLV